MTYTIHHPKTCWPDTSQALVNVILGDPVAASREEGIFMGESLTV